MTISQTYGVMQAQIADELGDNQTLLAPLSDSTLTQSPIQNAIQSAVAKWERERFYFNEILVDFNAAGSPTSPWYTVNGQEYYTSSDYAGIATIAKFDKIWVLVSAQRYFLEPRTFQELVSLSVSPSNTGQPTDYAYSGEQVKIYPIPNGAYPVGFLGTKRFSTLSLSADANVWTQDAFDLVRTEAKLILAEEVLHDASIAAECKIRIYGDPQFPKSRGYLSALKGETTRRRGMSKMRPTSF